uniref:A kinase (PRKA) anchor protein 9 n=1 Tax=Myripristis murdjan TaxID=586833 RepID=A0A667X5M4_9TELE
FQVEQKKQHASITETKHSTLEAQLQTEREALDRKEKEISNLEEQLEQFREELENKSEEVQQLHMQLEIQRKELSSQQQYLETRDSMLQVNRHPVAGQIDRCVCVMIMSEQDRLKRNSEEELDQLNAVIDRLQQELANIEQKQTTEEDEDIKGESGPSKEEYDEMKQKMDLATKELDTLKTEHTETEKLESPEGELEEALREKTAGLVVMQAQVHALEQSATSRVEELGHHIQELEDSINEKDSELCRCRLLLEQTQNSADVLQQKVSSLEQQLREKMAAALVSQATLEALQQQSQGAKEDQEPRRQVEPQAYEFGDFGIPQMDFSGLSQARQVPTTKVVHLTEKLRELEVGLSGMQKDQELQKQLLSSSEEEVLEYERRLAVLMDLLSQMKTKAGVHQRAPLSVEVRVRPLSSRGSEEATVTGLQQELMEVQNEAAATKEELSTCRESLEKLQELLQVRKPLDVKSKEEGPNVTELLQELQEVRKDAAAAKEELKVYRQRTEKLQDDLQARDLSISKLKEELSSSSTSQPKRKGGKQLAGKGGSTKDKPDSEQQHVALIHSCTQTEALQMPGLDGKSSSAATKEEMEEVIGDFEEKIVQMQELHAAEILDMEARHISESETLRRDTQVLENECKALKAIIDKLRSTEAPSSRLDRPTSSQFKDGYTSDSSSDYSQRTGYDLPNLQQEYRTTPEGARRETDDTLPDRIKTLLREVHQEGMQVLSLSELPVAEGEPGSQFHAPGWAKEREALLATVESLKGLITQMQTHRETQTSGGVDWRGELLGAVQQVFVRERSLLKSALYSQLDLLDTNDAIIHLNQLERRLTEQDTQHREAMGSLYTTDRSSLVSEIHQLRGQLEQLQQGLPPAVSSAGERSTEEQQERGGADGGAEADRLLVEELKGELAQTKLELETTLKAQHKHLKELDTLRMEVSQKAAEVDALNDQLSEERKTSRELQWAMEKEKCRTGRNEESKREELEDLHLTLGEQQSRVSQLTSALEQERQASSQLAQQADQERLSLHRRLQELQVQLETERAKAQEMSSALGRERELRTGVTSDGRPSNEEEEVEEDIDLIFLPSPPSLLQVVHLLGEVEAQKLEVVRKQEELTLVGQRSRRDQEALLAARAQLESLEVRMSEAQEQLERELERRKSLEEEKERLEERLAQRGEQREGDRAGGGVLPADGRSVSANSITHFSYVCTWISAALLAGGSSSTSNSLTERLLRQNAELTGFVSRLTEEKNDLRNQTLRLEEELRRLRQGDSSSIVLSQEREAWTRERIRLEKALLLAQAQVARLRGEIRTDTLRDITGPEADNAALKRMYGKYLRSESFRKALIYQKKYLLLLLGGFQECEEATLSLISRMGGRPSLSSLDSLSQRRRGLTRFRSAVRVSIALSRMRFLVKRWQKATGMGSVSSTSVNKNETGQTIGTERDSPYLHPASVEVFRERGGGLSSSRGRSGRDSPRSAVSSTHHRFHVAGDPGALTCSHLQNYDPDRALTDYISRLEALQRRLGSVTSGSSSYAQLHFGLRR